MAAIPITEIHHSEVKPKKIQSEGAKFSELVIVIEIEIAIVIVIP